MRATANLDFQHDFNAFHTGQERTEALMSSATVHGELEMYCRIQTAGKARVCVTKLMMAEFHLAVSVSGPWCCASWLTVMAY